MPSAWEREQEKRRKQGQTDLVTRGSTGFERAIIGNLNERRTLLTEDITSDETISDVTRNELLTGLGEVKGAMSGTAAGGKIAEVSKIFSEAKEGVDPKFRSRQGFKQKKRIAADQPGQRQLRGTVLGGGPTTLVGK